MEVIEPKRKFSYQKKKLRKSPNSAKKDRESPLCLIRKDINDEPPQEGTNQVRKRASKFNSIDDPNLFSKKLRFNNNPPALVSPRKHKKKIPKKENNITEYLDKLYKDEPHFRKSVIRKKTTKVNFKGFGRKVSFANPKEKKNSKQNVNIMNINKSSILNQDEDDKNQNKSKIFDNNDLYGDQAYGYDKKYVANLIRDDEMTLKSVIVSDKNLFNSRNIKRKQTSKTNKSTKKVLNILKYRSLDKKDSNKSINSTKRQVSSKSNDKKIKKKEKEKEKENKAIKIKDKDKDKDKEKRNSKNNVEGNDGNKNKAEKNNKKNDKKENEDENVHSKNKKHKKSQELLPKNEIENIDTVIQLETQNKKKKKKQFCCYPFFVCLKSTNNEDNDNVL